MLNEAVELRNRIKNFNFNWTVREERRSKEACDVGCLSHAHDSKTLPIYLGLSLLWQYEIH